MSLVEILRILVSAVIGFALLFHLWALYEVWAFTARRQAPSPNGPWPPVSVLKPLGAWNAEVQANLATFCAQDYPRYQVVVGPRADIAPRVRLDAVCTSDARREVTLVTCDERRAVNPKINQVLQMMPAVRHPVIVLADADMRVTPEYLRHVVAPLRDPAVGVVTCYHIAREAPTLPALVEALLVNTEYLPSILVGRRLQGMHFAFGATIALRRDVLEAIGGFEALADFLADDYQIAHRAIAAGYRVVLSDYLVESRLPPMTWREVVLHQLRWARTNRACQPTGWFFSLVTHLTFWCVVWWVLSGFSLTGQRLVALSVLFRVVQTMYYNARVDGLQPAWSGAWLAPVRDALFFFVWLWSHLTDRVVWAGRVYEVFPDGRMREVPAEEVAAGKM